MIPDAIKVNMLFFPPLLQIRNATKALLCVCVIHLSQ